MPTSSTAQPLPPEPIVWQKRRVDDPADQTTQTAETNETGPRKRDVFARFRLTGSFWYRAHLWTMQAIPRWSYRLLLPIGVALFFVVLGGIRRAIASNLEAVLGPCGFWERQRRVLRTLWNHGWCLTERYETLGTGRMVETDTEGWDHWRETAESGQGFVLATAHLGHWEAGSLYPSEIADRTIHIVREEEANPEAQAHFEAMLAARGDRYHVHFANRSADLGPKLLRALRRGEAVGLQADRPARGGRSIEVELFGRPFEVPIGAAAVARSAEAPILPVFIYRTGRLRSHMIFRPPIRLEKTADARADIRRGIERLIAEVEAAIRRDPYQWFCFTEIWPRRPASEAD